MLARSKLGVLVLVTFMFLGLTSMHMPGFIALAEAQEELTANLTSLGGAPGGVGFVVLEAMAKVVKKAYPGINITVVKGGWVENLPRLNKGEADIASTTIAMCGLAEARKAPFEEPMPNLRALYGTQDKLFFFAIVKKDLPVSTISEIVKKKYPVKVGTLKQGTTTELCWRAAFESQGVTWDNIKSWGGEVVFAAWPDLVKEVQDGKLDGILAVGARKIQWAEELCMAKDMKILKWDKELIDTMEQKFGFDKDAIPMGTYKGVNYNVIAPTDSGEILVSVNMPDKIVYAIVKALAENASDYAKEHVALADFKAENMAKGMKLPFHHGALKYYKEKGYIK